MIVSSNPLREPTATGESDSALGALIDDLVDRLRAGEAVDLAACGRDHPEHEGQIRGLFPALEMMAALGRPADRGANGLPPPGNDPRLGSGVLGDYRIVREIGRGGMGVVFEAVQVSLGRRVALKILPLAAAIDPRHLQRFQLEAQAAAHLHHPHIVPIHAVGCDRGVHYYAMQFVEGRSLAELVRENRRETVEHSGADFVLADDLLPGRPMEVETTAPELNHAAEATREPSGSAPPSREVAPARSVARLGIQAAEALEHAHALGVLHRDIKPANLLVEASGHLWVADFGLARFGADSDLTRTGDILGTLRYMSPEQALAHRVVVDHRTDIYSLGATLYELLTARPAFDGHNRQELLRRIADEDPTPPRQFDPTIPRDLETIVLKAMAKEPEGRYATAQELADDLRRFLADEPIRARRPGPMERVARWTRRHRPAVVSTAVVLLLALAAGTGLLWRSNLRTEAALASLSAERKREKADYEWMFVVMDRLADPMMIKAGDPQVGLNSEDRRTIADLIAFYDHTVAGFPEDSTHAEVIAKAARRSGLYRVRLEDPGADRDYGRAIRVLDEYARRAPTHIWLRTELIDVLREYAEGLAARDRTDAAEKVFRQALTVAEPLLAEESATHPCFSKGLVKQFDSLARSLATEPSGRPGDLALAVRMAEWAVEREPAEGAFRQTLDLCRYRIGDWASAVATSKNR